MLHVKRPSSAGRVSLATIAREWGGLAGPRTTSRKVGRRPGRIVLVEGRRGLPWSGGVSAADLGAALAPLVDALRAERLDDPALWGRPVPDERCALAGEV